MSDFSHISDYEYNYFDSNANNMPDLISFSSPLFSMEQNLNILQSNNLKFEGFCNHTHIQNEKEEEDEQLINNNNNLNFIIPNEDNNESNYIVNKINFTFIKKKRGRKRNLKPNNNRLEHNKLSKDNIKTKIQVHYLKFLRNLINQIIKEIIQIPKNIKKFQFYPLDYKFTTNVTKKSFESLKDTRIGDIFKNNVSHKYKKYEILNINVYNKVTNISNVVKNILDELYLEYFNLYYSKIQTINLSKYGLDSTITLSDNVGFYSDLIKDIVKNDEIYHEKIEKCIKKEFI
jgi:hypothetical protein